MNYLSRAYIREKWGEAGFQKYFQNAAWMFFTRMFTLGVSFLTTLYVARTLGPTNFGELDYALAVVGIFGIVGGLGIEGVLNRELVKYPEQHNTLVGTATALRLMLGMTATTLVIVFALISHIDPISKILLILLSLTYTLSTLTILQQTFLARAESKYPSLIAAAVALTMSAIKIAILLTGKGIIYLASSLLVESVLSGTLYFIAYNRSRQGRLSEWRFSPAIARIMLKTGSAVAFLSMFAIIYSRIDQIMIRNMIDATAVGLYGAGVRLVDVWGFIPMIIGASLYPAVLNARKISENLYYKRLRKLFLLYSLPAIGIAVVVSLGAKHLMLLIYGSEFVTGYQSLQIYVWSLPGTFVGFYIMNILFTDDFRKILIFTSAVPALVNVLLNLAWIPQSGIIGAAWATAISYSLIPFMPLLFKDVRTILYGIYKS